MSLDQEALSQQLALLATHRRTLAHLLQQAAQFGGEVFAPPQTANGIAEARAEIRRIKATLREGGMSVENEPNDDVPSAPEPVQRADGDVVMGDKVGGDKVMGDKRTINTGGGDYAEGNIDKRQGAFVAGGIVQGPVIGPNEGTVNVNYTYHQVASVTLALHQLRAPVNDFVGREREIDQLVQALSKMAAGGAAAAINSVRGMGGIGKTELTYVVAHQLKDAFPDAQLLVELRGASRTPLTPEQALQTVIRVFEPEARLPDELGQLQALYRSLLNRRRALILADDAKDAVQVRPLMPPAGCALLVTSRNRFSVPGMTALDLGTLPSEEAERLLIEICPRIGKYAAELANLCGYLPLALRVSASLLASRQSRRVEAYLEQLKDERTKLEHLRDPRDLELDVAASLRLSYDALDEAAKSALRQLSTFPMSFDLDAAQNAVVLPPGNTIAVALEDLYHLSLLEWDDDTKRFNLHDLVRTFAADRLIEFHEQALAIARTLGHGRGEEYALLSLGANYLRLGNMQKAIDYYEQALTIDRTLGNGRGEERVLHNLGSAHLWMGDVQKAIDYYEQALTIDRTLGNRHREAITLDSLGSAHRSLGDVQKAIDCYEQALSIGRGLDDQCWVAIYLNNLGVAYSDLGEIRKAIDYYEQALAIFRKLGDRRGEAIGLGDLGSAYAALGDTHQAISFYEQDLAVFREIGDRTGEASISWKLGLALEKQGDLARAAKLMQVYGDFEREIGHSDAEKDAARLAEVRQRLAGGDGGPVVEEGE